VPIEPPDLDDLRYERVRDLLRSRIPIHAPEWTDHNDSDPGMAILQLFAFLADQVGYRLNRVPDRNYVAFLELLGMRLSAAEAARTLLALVLTKPELLAQRLRVPAGSTATSTAGAKPTFEVDAELEVVPAQLGALITTVSSDLRELDPDGELTDDVIPEDWLAERFTVAWNGKDPKLEEMPVRPIRLGQLDQDGTHTCLWVGLLFNPNPTAGFLGTRVTLTVQLDDDEQPVSEGVLCGEAPVEQEPEPVAYGFYRPQRPGETQGSWVPLAVLSDTTDGLRRSGQLRFDVPKELGPIPDDEWEPVRAASPMTLEEICAAANGDPEAVPPEEVPHPLPGTLPISLSGASLVVPISGWLSVAWPGQTVPALSVRQITFNVAPVTAARTVVGELLGRGTGRPGQQLRLANGNVLADTLALAVEDLGDGLLHDWTEVGTLDGAAPDATVYLLDREEGAITFGDGDRGRPPPLRCRIVAIRYRHGGGPDGNVPAGTVTKPSSMPAEITGTTILYAARGGREAETLEQLKARAPTAIKVLERAVTNADFEYLALRTEGANAARTLAVGLRRPLPEDEGPGLDHLRTAAGAISVVVVPDEPGAYPRPTLGMLRTVCAWLDRYRLVTTELHVLPPMYVRLFDLEIVVVAAPGHSANLLRESLAADLEGWLHVLTGGDDGQGWPFGGVLPHSALLARLFRATGVQRIESLVLKFDGFAPAAEGDSPEQVGRRERLTPRTLTACPTPGDSSETDRIELRPDEVVFVDTSTMLLEVRSA
jgi:hypothetical protein